MSKSVSYVRILLLCLNIKGYIKFLDESVLPFKSKKEIDLWLRIWPKTVIAPRPGLGYGGGEHAQGVALCYDIMPSNGGLKD